MERRSVDTNTPVEDPDIPQLRFLRALVTVLAGVMIVGLLVLIVLIVIRFRHDSASFPALPAAITLPDGVSVQSMTAGPGWYMIVTTDGRALVYGTDGALVSESQLTLP